MQSSGFSLIELLLALLLVATIVVFGIPTLYGFVESTRVRTQTREFATSVSLARSLAITTATPVIICASRDGTECNSKSWSDGWLIYADTDKNEQPSKQELVNFHQALPSPLSLVESKKSIKITFSFDGTLTTNFTFFLCGSSDKRAGKISILATGRSRASQVAGSSAC